jgi:hypothetical protein
MKINSDINILGGLPDFNLIQVFLNENNHSKATGYQSFTTIKTEKSIKRFKKAIANSFFSGRNSSIEMLTKSNLIEPIISNDGLLHLFWVASFNNDIISYLNTNVFFAAFYSGRITIKKDEVVACLKDLRTREPELKKWSDSTLEITASKYLTLLKKFNLMTGALNKTIVHPYLNDKMFVLFIYWLKAIEVRPNILESEWLKYCFSEQSAFVERVLQKKFLKYYQLTFTGDNLKIETTYSYDKIYDAIK